MGAAHGVISLFSAYRSWLAARILRRRSRTERSEARRCVTAATLAVVLLANLVTPVVPALAATPPIANAGVDRTVPSGTQVKLDGTLSTSAGGIPVGYTWTQLSGPTVELTGLNASHSKVEFFAPLVASSTELVFQLTVNDGTSSDSATVTVTVVPGTMPYRLNRQPGRAGYQDIKSVGRTVYTAWCYRNGGALEVWFSRSFDGGATYETPQCLSREDPLPFVGLGDCEYPTIAVDGLNTTSPGGSTS